MSKNPKTLAGQPVIKVNHQRLQIVLSYRDVRKYLSLGLPDSKPNRVYAELVMTRMMSDLLNDNFDPSLEKYRREALKPDSEIHTRDNISTALVARFAFAQLWKQYTN